MKLIKLNFRQTTDLYINDIQKVKCSFDSPQCLREFLPTRYSQIMCTRCLNFYGVIDQCPLVNIEEFKIKKIKIVTTDY